MGGVEMEYAGASPVIPDLIGDPEKMDSHLRGNDSSGGDGIEYAGHVHYLDLLAFHHRFNVSQTADTVRPTTALSYITNWL